MPKRTRDYTIGLRERLTDPGYAVEYLNAALDESESEHSETVFLLALRDVVEAQPSFSGVARLAGLNRESLYRMLSGNGNPHLRSIKFLLRSLGLKLTVAPASDNGDPSPPFIEELDEKQPAKT